jgi:hypothetical protein
MTFNISLQVPNLNYRRKQQRSKRIVIKTVGMTSQTVIPAAKKSVSLPSTDLSTSPRRMREMCMNEGDSPKSRIKRLFVKNPKSFA